MPAEPSRELTWNCLSRDGTATTSNEGCGARNQRNRCGPIVRQAPTTLACEAPPGCPDMPVGSCTTSGDPTNLDCTLNCPANYVVNNSPATALPYTVQCLTFDLPSDDFESCVCDPSIPNGVCDPVCVHSYGRPNTTSFSPPDSSMECASHCSRCGATDRQKNADFEQATKKLPNSPPLQITGMPASSDITSARPNAETAAAATRPSPTPTAATASTTAVRGTSADLRMSGAGGSRVRFVV